MKTSKDIVQSTGGASHLSGRSKHSPEKGYTPGMVISDCQRCEQDSLGSRLKAHDVTRIGEEGEREKSVNA